MKKYSIILLVILFLVSACSISPDKSSVKTGNKSVTVSGDLLSDLSIINNLRTGISSSTLSVGLSRISSTRGVDSENYGGALVSRDGETSSEKLVDFFIVDGDFANVDVNGDVREKGEKISQSDIPGSLDKTYVLGDFTIISYLRLNLDNLLNSTDTTVDGDGYSGTFDFSEEKDSVLKTLSFEYKDGDDFVTISYSYLDEEKGEIVSKKDEKVEFRTDENTYKLSSEDMAVSYFDTYGYENSFFRSNYLIDNTSGLIYALPDGWDISAHKGVLYDSVKGPVDISLSDSGLVVSQIIQNTTIALGDFFKDKYNQYYVLNDSFDEVDNGNGYKVMYYTQINEYIPLKNGEVLHVEFADSKTYFGTRAVKSVSIVGKEFAPVEIEEGIDVDISYSSLSGLEIAPYFVAFNKERGVEFNVNVANGSMHFFDRIEENYLYSYYCDESAAVFARVDLRTNSITFNEYFSRFKQSYYALLDAESLLIASNEYVKNKNNYSLYVVYPFKDKEYREHYYNYILSSSGELTQSPTYDWFRKKYYSAFRYSNTDKYTPDEVRAKWHIDENGTDAWVKGWEQIKGMSFDAAGINSDTLETVYYYYMWKDGYSEEDFDKMYNDYIYKEDGVVKCDITQHTLLENISVSDWDASDVLNMKIEAKSVSGNASYYIVEDTVNGGYKAEEAERVEMERSEIVLQPLYRNV